MNLPNVGDILIAKQSIMLSTEIEIDSNSPLVGAGEIFVVISSNNHFDERHFYKRGEEMMTCLCAKGIVTWRSNWAEWRVYLSYSS